MQDLYISSFPTPLATRIVPEAALHPVSSAVFTVLAAVCLTACDRLGEVVILPEVELVDSFEGGVAAWSARSADLGTPAGTWSVVGTQTAASDGTRALSLHFDNTGGAGKVWVVREVELSPDQAYDVVVGFDLGLPGTLPASPWTIIAGSYATAPSSAAGLTFRDGAAADSVFTTGGVTWGARRYQTTLRTTADGMGVVVLGLWGTTSEDRIYYLDNVRVLFTRR